MFDSNMMERLQKAQQEIENIKLRLEQTIIEASSPSDKVKVSITASKKIQSITIDSSLQNTEIEELEDHLIMALNEAISRAEAKWEMEMKSAASGLLPGL